MQLDTSIPLNARVANIGNPFLEAFSTARQLQMQQQSAAALEEERQARAAERKAQEDLRKRQLDQQSLAEEALRRGGGVRGTTLAWATEHAPGTLEGLTKFFDESEQRRANIDKLQGDLNNARMDHLGHLADGVLAHGATPEALTTALSLYAEQFPNEKDAIAQTAQRLQGASPEQLKGALEQLRNNAPYYQSQQQKAAERGPTVVSSGALVDPTGKVLYTAPEKTSFQAKDVMLDGKRAAVNFNPATGKYTDANGQDVSARVAPIPPASIIINNQKQQGSTMPEFALTDARPVGTEGNKPDPTIRMTPNGLFQAAQTFIASGQYPPTGRGTDAISVNQREAINAKVGAIAAAAGMDVPTLRAFYKSNAASLAATQKSVDAVQAFMTTADRNADLLRSAIKDIPDSGVPLLNQPLRAFATKVAGDPKMAKAATYLQSVSNEYARIIAQPNLSGQLTDAARKEASVLLDPKATVQQMLASIDALQQEGNNRVLSLGDQIARIGSRMQGGANATPGAPPQTPAAGATGGAESLEHRVWRVGGKIGPEPK